MQARFHGLRLAALLKAEHNRPGKLCTAKAKQAHRIRSCAGLHDDRIEAVNSLYDFRQWREHGLELLDLDVNGRGFFKGKVLRSLLSWCNEFANKRPACGIEEGLHARDFGMVLGVGAALEAGREAHFHFGINATGK